MSNTYEQRCHDDGEQDCRLEQINADKKQASEGAAVPVAREDEIVDAFEKWAESEGFSVAAAEFGGGYEEENTAYAWYGWKAAHPQPPVSAKPQPLTLDQLSEIVPGAVSSKWSDFVSIARAVEAAHAITQEPT